MVDYRLNSDRFYMKFWKMAIPIAAAGVIGVAAFAAPTFSSIEKTPEIKGSIFYSMKNTPSGFSLVSGYNNSALPELTGKQNPNPIKNNAGTCTFSPQIAYLPSTDAGRGDKYLTQSYIYQNAQISAHLPSAIRKNHISAGNTNLEVFISSYDVPASKDNSDKGYYRTVVVRAMDITVPIPYVSGSESKGIPIIVMTYDCQTANDYKNDDLSALLSSVNVNLTDTISNDPASKKDTVKPTVAPSDTPSATATAYNPGASESPSESPSTTATNSSTVSPTGAVKTKSSPVISAKPSPTTP
jgi:hypothetical protein